MKESLSDNMRNIIIDAARQVFLRYGFFKTTMEDISRAVGKGKSSLYYYFKSKEEIFEMVLAEELKPHFAEAEQILSGIDDSQHKFYEYLLLRMKILKRLVELYYIEPNGYFEHFAFIEKIRHDYDEAEKNYIRRILEYGNAKGVFAIKDLSRTVDAVIAAFKGYEYLCVIEDSGAKMDEKLKTFTELLYFGIARR
jgi:AcrR family transcriptional regulator